MAKTKKFKVGDSVRLNKGWTEMIVIEVRSDESIVAKYRSANEEDYAYPYKAASTKHRDADEFTAWDGMADRYKTGTGEIGIFRGITKDGRIILEMESGLVSTFLPGFLTGISTQYFAARQLIHPNRTFFFKMTDNQEKLGLGVGALLIDKGDRMYRVKAIYPHFNPNGDEKIFEGSFFPSLDFA